MYKLLKKIISEFFNSVWNKLLFFMHKFQPTIIEILNFTASFYSSISIVNRFIAAFLGLGSLLFYGRYRESYLIIMIVLILIILLSYHVLNLFTLGGSLLYLYLSTLFIIIISKSLLLSFVFYLFVKIFVVIKIIKFKGFK